MGAVAYEYRKGLSTYGYSRMARSVMRDPRLNASDTVLMMELVSIANHDKKPKIVPSRHPQDPPKLVPRGSGYFSQVYTFSGMSRLRCPKTIRRAMQHLAMLGYITYTADWRGTFFSFKDFDAVMLGTSAHQLESRSYKLTNTYRSHSKSPEGVPHKKSDLWVSDYETSKKYMDEFDSQPKATGIPPDARALLERFKRGL